MFKKIIILQLLVFSTFLFSKTAEELLNPKNNAYDFTLTNNNSLNEYTPIQYVDKVEMSVEKILGLVPRIFNTFDCKNDIYGNTYCPESLELAREYTAYSPSTAYERTQTVIDFEQGTYQELTSTVRDFMDGFASTHNSTVTDYQTGSGTSNVGTVIDYQNGSSVKRTGFVMDYANKTQGTVIAPNSIKKLNINMTGGGYASYYFYEHGPYCGGRGYEIDKSTDMLTDYYHCPNPEEGDSLLINVDPKNCTKNGNITTCSGLNLGTNVPRNITLIGDNTYIKITDSSNKLVLQGPGSLELITINNCPSGYSLRADGKCQKSTLACPSGYTDNGTNCQKSVSFDFYQYTCPSTYSPINSGFTSYTKTDPNTSAQNWNTLDDAVNSATAPTGNCQKTITYSYYKYNCPTGYTVRDGGLTSACPRTDPNKTINNESTLSQPCNNSIPPTGNCEKIIPYTFYSYECSSGYTAIDKGLATCTKTDSSTSTNTSSTLSQPCNSATPPKENCYKDISYKHYTYGCSPGYITDNYGLSTCPKTDPNKSVNNSATLDDDCNSKTPPPGNCRKSYSYKYYEYLCEGTNSFNENYEAINKGLSTCTKTDNDINKVNSELADNCNSSTPPINNCKSSEYSCDSTIFKPAFVDGNWKCSPYMCNGEMKCGYASCQGNNTSLDYYMLSSLNLLKSEVKLNTSDCNTSYEYIDGNSTAHYIKYCSNGIIENATCLEKDANNKCVKFDTTNPDAKCKSGTTIIEPSKQYTYYTYSCPNEKNSFGFNWEIINNITTDPGCIDDTFGKCLNFEKLSNNCKRKTLGCTSGSCQFQSSSNQWKCVTGTISLESSSCNSPICDLVLNNEISYCENEVCPTANGIYERNNQCYMMLCPDGTFEIDGKCGVE